MITFYMPEKLYIPMRSCVFLLLCSLKNPSNGSVASAYKKCPEEVIEVCQSIRKEQLGFINDFSRVFNSVDFIYYRKAC